MQTVTCSIFLFLKTSVGTKKQLTPTKTGTRDPVPLPCNQQTHVKCAMNTLAHRLQMTTDASQQKILTH